MAYDSEFKTALAEALKAVKSVHAVGEEWVSYVGEIPAGGVPYCGQEVTRETYSALWEYVNAKGLVKTESEWQELNVSQNGNVAFYSSGDGSSTFRMPKLIGYVRGASSQVESGGYVAEGLPNITGAVWNLTVPNDPASTSYQLPSTSGAFSQNDKVEGVGYAGTNSSNQKDGFKLDASRSSAIYGNSAHVTPETSVVLFGVYAFGEVTNAGEIDATTLAGELASVKASYLPLEGGTMTGAIRVADTSAAIRRERTDSEVRIHGATDLTDGATLVLYGKDSASGVGGALIRTTDGTQTVDLKMYPDGKLYWGGLSLISQPNYAGATSYTLGNAVTAHGWVYVWISKTAAAGDVLLSVNGVQVADYYCAYSQSRFSAFLPVRKGDKVTLTSSTYGTKSAKFFPCK